MQPRGVLLGGGSPRLLDGGVYAFHHRANPGLNISLAAMLFSSTLGIMGVIAAGHTPIYYGSGYIKGKDWWVLGFIFGAIYLGIFLLVGLPWNLARQ